MTLTSCLAQLDSIQGQRAKVLEEALQRIQNSNHIEELILVNQGMRGRQEVFDKNRSEYAQLFSSLDPLEQQRAEVNQNIANSLGPFGQLISSVNNDPAKAQFFQSIDQAINLYNDLQNMLHQGSQFYTRLGDLLNKLYQNIMDFRMSREMEKNDLISKMGNF
mmetsp:Transcript_17093/g.16315  ORF Transcript_17093/g.16315 Transcript_17093/m.16315 type:complete len:163 (+) Transcript_17093:1702-2190(+)